MNRESCSGLVLMMLYCGLSEIEAGMKVAASVFHPRRSEIELLAPGVALERPLLARLAKLGVSGVWVEHNLTDDLDPLINATPSPTLRTACQQLRHDFNQAAQKTVSSGQIQVYRQIVMDLVCELIANRKVSGLTERLVQGPAALFTHSANVAYLAVSVGLELETYIVKARHRMAIEHAKDLTALGLGAMLHDIGKVALADAVQGCTILNPAPAGQDGEGERYSSHPALGYEILGNSRLPATARQVVLNHHQRWDGTGFPDLAGITQQRRTGAQRGDDIHVFCRVVAAADTLDHLLSDAGEEGRQPLVAALHAFQSARFDGWFDPVVRDAMLRKVAPFPVGSRVTLSDGRTGVVAAPSLAQPCRPVIRLLQAEQADAPATGLDLNLDRSRHITTCGGDPVEQYLFDLPDDCPLAIKAMKADPQRIG